MGETLGGCVVGCGVDEGLGAMTRSTMLRAMAVPVPKANPSFIVCVKEGGWETDGVVGTNMGGLVGLITG